MMSKNSSPEVELGGLLLGSGLVTALGGLVVEAVAPGAGEFVTMLGLGATAVGTAVVGVNELTRPDRSKKPPLGKN